MRNFLACVLSVAISSMAIATGPVTWTFTTRTAADGTLAVSLKAVCEEGWHIYALTLPRDDGPFPTVISVANSEPYTAGAVQEPTPEEVDDPNFLMRVRYHSGSPEFLVPIKRSTNGAFEVTGSVEFMSCNDKTCLPPQTVKFTVPIDALK